MSLGIPVIGSLNGVSTGGWIEFAKLIEEAGARRAWSSTSTSCRPTLKMTGLDITKMHEEIVKRRRRAASTSHSR